MRKAKQLVLIASLIGIFFTKSFACSFCDPEILERQSFYEGEHIIALCDYRPILPGHCLVIPKRHVERFEDLTDEEAMEMTLFIKKLHATVSKLQETDDYLLLQKNGASIGQSVPHVHIHYIPKKSTEAGALMTLARFFWVPRFGSRLSHDEVKVMAEALRGAMQDSEAKAGPQQN